MKPLVKRIPLYAYMCLAIFLLPAASNAQGRLVINEFMAWPGESCPTTAEFIELKNMGPGPMNIGCHVITDGDFSITIPANTFLKPGEFYVLGGQDIINAPCANLTRNITVNLNWNTCNCTSGSIATEAEGLLTDGGAAGEQLVLFNPSGTIIDAVVREINKIETSSSITSRSTTGCTGFSFDLDNLSIIYEEIGESQGRANSFARKMDGDCKWVKETQQNAGATNNAAGEAATLTMTQTYTMNQNCNGGNATFTVTNTSPTPASFFPFTYILGYDNNGNGVFESGDFYTNGTDATAPSVELTGLGLGSYNIILEPASGCNQKFFTFDIGPCATMPIKLKQFKGSNAGKLNRFNIDIETDADMKILALESSLDGKKFYKVADIPFADRMGLQNIVFSSEAGAESYFRLAMTDDNNKTSYSNIVNLVKSSNNNQIVSIAPNPFTDFLGLSHYTTKEDVLMINIISAAGQVVLADRYALKVGQNNLRLLTSNLAKGLYLVSLKKISTGESQITRVLKN
ncbi:MAG: lamin tail domain-containing protein [bacterium]